MANFPATLDDSSTLPNPIAGNFTTAPDHAVLHSTENDAIKALEAKLGTGASTATAGTLLRGTGIGTTAFAQANLTADVTGTLPVANGGTGVTSSTGSGANVLGTSPTIVTPTIASFANANHTHQNSAGGGTLAESALVLTDVTTNDVSITKHGFTPKAPNDTTKFLRGDASWSIPSYLVGTGMQVTAPVDATTYYTAYGNSSLTTEASSRFYIPFSTILTSVYLNVSTTSTVGTTETSTISIRKNNSTDTTVSSSVVSSTGVTTYNNASMGLSLIAGDYIAVKWVTPTWVTNPGVVNIQVSLGFNV